MMHRYLNICMNVFKDSPEFTEPRNRCGMSRSDVPDEQFMFSRNFSALRKPYEKYFKFSKRSSLRFLPSSIQILISASKFPKDQPFVVMTFSYEF